MHVTATVPALVVALAMAFSQQAMALDLGGLEKTMKAAQEIEDGGKDKKAGKGKKADGKDDDPLAMLQQVRQVVGGETEEEEIEAGRQVGAQLLGASRPLDNADVQRYVTLVGLRVAARSERPDLPWRFVVLDDPDINAFAAPGGRVFITAGLYRLLQSEDELAGVIGHEVAHVVRKHHYNVLRKQKITEAATGALQKSVADGDEGGALAQLAGYGGELLARGLDKAAEYEADRDGVVLAARAGYDSTALLAVLERIGQVAEGQDSIRLLFATHPSPTLRINELLAAFTGELEAAAVASGAAGRITAHALP